MLGRSRHTHAGRAASILLTAAMAIAAALTPTAMAPQARAAESDPVCTASGRPNPQPDSSGKSGFYYTSDCVLHISRGDFDFLRVVPVPTSPISDNDLSGPYVDAREIVFDDPAHTVLTQTSFRLNRFRKVKKITGIEDLDVSKVTDLTGLLQDDFALKGTIDLSKWKVGNVTKMSSAFAGVGAYENDLDALPDIDITGWDTGKLKDMSSMFYSSHINSVKGLDGIDTSNVQAMGQMFSGAAIPSRLDLSRWKTGNVLDMFDMFHHYYFMDQVSGLSNWDVSKVTNMTTMFCQTYGKITLDMSGWHTDSLRSMDEMFSDADDVSGLTGTGNLNVSKVTNFRSVFNNAGKLTTLDMSGWVMDGAKTRDTNFLATPVERVITGPHVRLTGDAFGAVWSRRELKDYDPTWSRIPEDINDDSGYWISPGTFHDADTAVAAEISTGRGGTWMRTISAKMPMAADTPDGSAASWSQPAVRTLYWAKTRADTSVPAEVPTSQDWTFTAWNTAKDGTGTSYAPGQIVKVTKGVHTLPGLYAQWERIMRSVKYVGGDGASSVPAAASVASGSDYTVPDATPVRPGYTFLGWSDGEGGEVKYRPGDSMKALREDRTLYAVWKVSGVSVLPAAGSHAAVGAGILAVISLLAIVCGAVLGRRAAEG